MKIFQKENTVLLKEGFTIGWCVYNGSLEFFAAMQDGVFAKAKELGMNVISHDEKGRTAEMITGALHLISLGIDALVIAPVTPEAMVVISDSARNAGIPIIVIDTGYDGADIDAFIVSDSLGGGVLAGEYALRLIRDHSITSTKTAIITVQEKYTYARRRGEGFKNVMTDRGYTIVAELPGNSNQADGYLAMKNILEAYGNDLAVVFCENDRMALGAARAINESGKTGQIMLLGFDGEPAAITAIKEGLMQGTIAQQPFEMGALGAELANTLLTGRTIIYDDRVTKELYMEVYLIDQFGEPVNRLITKHK